MIKIQITGNSAALDADGLANDVAYASGGYALTATTSGDSLAHKITVLGNAATNHSAKTITVTGTDADGNVQTETMAGPNGIVTVTTAKFYLTVTSVTIDATTNADTFDIGWTAASVSPWYHVNKQPWGPNGVGFGCVVDSGTPTYTVEQQYGDGTKFNHATVASETTSQEGSYTTPVRAIRLSWAAAGGVTLLGWY